jgi:hypothetical protein
MPTGQLLNTFDDLPGSKRMLTPKHVEHALF